jgi:enoyl-CoA hydratase/carnithine racemase
MASIGPFENIEVTSHGHVACVELRRPPNNFFSTLMIREIADAYAALDKDDNCRAIVLCAQGKHFCAGNDFNRSRDASSGDGDTYAEAVRLFHSGKPIVAAVQGAAIGGGLGLAMSTDFRVTCPEARFAANFALLGFHHGFGLTVTLPRAVGNQQALLMLLTGRRIGGEEATRIGLAEQCVPLAEVRNAAFALANEIALAAPLAVRSIRATMRGKALAEAFAHATATEGPEQRWLRATEDFREGVRSVTERRPGNFQSR